MRLLFFRACIASILASMAFTGYYGWIVGYANGDFFSGFLNLVAGVLVSAFVPLFWWLRAEADKRHVSKLTIIVYTFSALMFSAMDLGTNIAAIFAMREGSIIVSEHKTKVAKSVRGEFQRIKAELEALSGKLRKYDADGIKTPSFYDAVIADLKTVLGGDGRNIWQRSKECVDVTLPESRSHCAKINEAKKKKSRAEEKVALTARYTALASTMPKTVEAVKENQIAKSGSTVISERIGQLLSGGYQPSNLLKELIYLVFTTVIGAGLTFASSLSAYAYNWLGEDEEEGPAHPVRARMITSGHTGKGDIDAPEEREIRMRIRRSSLPKKDILDDTLERLAEDIADAHRHLTASRAA